MTPEPFATVPNDTSADALKKQVELLRAAGPQKRMAIFCNLNDAAKAMSLRAIAKRHPHLKDREIRLKYVEVVYGKKLAEQVKRYLEDLT